MKTIDYLGRELDVRFDVSKPDFNHNYPGEIEVTSVKLNGREISGLIDTDPIQDILYNEVNIMYP